ncbi:MAG: glycosyltransferase family 4 protein [Ruminococcaceae bacterium]|nr:glycosyltransferase family 4 protein [Oscillospiraceae bacterium]
MRILLVNKFLYPKGGAETYIFKLGEMLTHNGHAVEYFGLQNDKNIVGNSAGAYVSDMDFGNGIKKNLSAPFRIIYSAEARRKIRKVLEYFEPDVVHLNNIQFHLTPSIILEAERYRKKTGCNLKIVYTAHDYQLICPSHGLFDPELNVCEKCLGGNYMHCFKTKCMKKSRMKSLLATADAFFWKYSKAYSYIDKIICPSSFLKSKLDTQERFSQKTVAIHNFIEPQVISECKKEGYVLEFGHLSRDKGTNTLLEAAKKMPDVHFVFAGFGQAEKDIEEVQNAEYVGFKTGDELKDLISKAACSVCPSQCYENCPFSVVESQMYGTPVIGSRMGGIPELISEGETGLLFDAGNAEELEEKLRRLIYNPDVLSKFTENCKHAVFETPETYYTKLMQIYGE